MRSFAVSRNCRDAWSWQKDNMTADRLDLITACSVFMIKDSEYVFTLPCRRIQNMMLKNSAWNCKSVWNVRSWIKLAESELKPVVTPSPAAAAHGTFCYSSSCLVPNGGNVCPAVTLSWAVRGSTVVLRVTFQSRGGNLSITRDLKKHCTSLTLVCCICYTTWKKTANCFYYDI